jgi:hypothetical protein
MYSRFSANDHFRGKLINGGMHPTPLSWAIELPNHRSITEERVTTGFSVVTAADVVLIPAMPSVEPFGFAIVNDITTQRLTASLKALCFTSRC